MQVIASIEGYQGESILIKDVETEQALDGGVFVEVTSLEGNKLFEGWLKVLYEIVPDGTYNQSVNTIELPYILIGKDVYSIAKFHVWDTE